ncbi:MAG TPA: zf-HC2 domain-containing protein [Candidatus Dormibacteraeota bacterium]|nr:zf-HC2 domain-containing protein [Candidatus Dormibacteraeota bacterium]
MPSEPRIPTEPTMDELSAYLDHELDNEAKARVAEHVAGCADCQARLDGLRQAAYAIRALPMETPPRTFVIPTKRRESFRWAPAAGWVGGVAAAMLIIVVGVQHLNFGGTTSAGSASPVSGGLAQNPSTLSQKGAAAPTGSPGSVTADSSRAFSPYSKTVTDPRNNARRLSLMINAATYATDGFIVVDGTMSGDPSSNVGQIRLLLRRGSYGVELPMPQQTFTNSNGIGFEGTYSIAALRLPNPATGSYTLTATWVATDGSAVTLFAELPVTIK